MQMNWSTIRSSLSILTGWSIFFCASCSTPDLKISRPKLSTMAQKSRQIFRPVWIKNHDPRYNSGNLPIGLQTPLIHRGIVYTGHSAGEMRAYELDSGRLVWKAEDNGSYHAGSIVVEDALIYGTVRGRLYARHRLNGKLLWNVDLGASVESEGVVARGRLYYHTRNHQIFCLDAKTGKILWAYKRSIPFTLTLQRAGRPLIYQNKLFVGFANGTVVALSMEEGALLWESKIFSGPKFIDVDTSPFIFNGQLIMGGDAGPVTVLDKDTGLITRQLKYRSTRRPLQREEQLLLGTTDGKVVLLDRNFKELRAQTISNTSISSLAFWKGGLVASTVDGHLVYMDARDLSIKAQHHLGHKSSAVFGALKVQDGTLVAYSGRNRLYAFR